MCRKVSKFGYGPYPNLATIGYIFESVLLFAVYMTARYETLMVIKFIVQTTLLETIKDFHSLVPPFEYSLQI